jgi:hypothetical protein
MKSDHLKYAAGAGLFILWTVLVIALKLNPDDLIGTIKLAVYAILGFVGVTKLQAAPQAPQAFQTTESDSKQSAPQVPLQKGPQ